MTLIPEHKIAEVRERTDIVEVIGQFVSLKRSGVNHKGLCPFHAEKTPSFNVNAAKQMYHCFGCGKSGDVITFIMETEGKPFIEVVRELARRAGVELPETEATPSDRDAARRHNAERSQLVGVTELAAQFFRDELEGARGGRGRAYIESRGIARAIVESFRLGYAPPGWDSLVRFLESKRVPHEVAERAGLVRQRENVKLEAGKPPSKATHFDLFRDRVMFPVINLQGEVVGFSGRLLEGEGPKYINSPETAVFKKSELLYGLHVAKQAMRRSGRAILVEGNFDVLSMHQHGLGETVAPLGTALTPAQVHLLHRFAPGKVFLCLDGDAAGYRAAARDVSLFLDEDLLTFVTLLPLGEDPDTFLRKQGHEAFELLLKTAKESVEYFCDHVWHQAGGSIIERVKVLEEEAAPLLRKVKNTTARRRYAERLAYGLDLPLHTIEGTLRGSKGSTARAVGESKQAQGAAEKGPAKLGVVDEELVALIADHPRLLVRLMSLGALDWLSSPGLRRGLEQLCRRTGSAVLDTQALGEAVEPALRGQVMAAAMSGRYADVADPERVLRDILHKHESRKILAELKETLAAARAAGDIDKVQQLNARISQLNQQRLGLAISHSDEKTR